jgi:tRNA A-37 threonylcarbamoyl transferase component Bud32
MSPREPADTISFLRDYLASNPSDVAARLRLSGLLVARGERAAARALLDPLEKQDAPAPEVIAELAMLDEEEGLAPAAVARWERLLADDVDHPQARAHLARLRGRGARAGVWVAGSAGGGGGGGDDPGGGGRGGGDGTGTGSGGALGSTAPTLGSPEGVTILRYEILREIGRGATATVYLARDQILGIALALKVLHPQLAAAGRSEACRRFFHEARVAAGLRHPGVVAIYDLDEGARTLVTEHLPGGTLRDRIRALAAGSPSGQGLPLAEVWSLASSLLAALAFVHARGVVHGDITPRNILLRRPGEAVLADFGSARLLEGTAAETVAGTPIYLAPEQFRGAASSPATDLFAVGAILWEALVGRPMRQHGELIANRFGAAPLPAAVVAALPVPARPLAVAVEALTQTDPGRRPPSARDALSLLRDQNET